LYFVDGFHVIFALCCINHMALQPCIALKCVVMILLNCS